MGKKERLSRKEKCLHEKAVSEKEFWYTDPETGKKVLTAYFLCERGYCCQTGCRWCPYGYVEGEILDEWDSDSGCEEG